MSRLGGSGNYFDRGAHYARACHAQPLAKLLSLLKSALVGGAVLGLIQPAFAVGVITSDQPLFPTSGQGVYAALLDLDGAKPATAPRGDDAFSALAGFAQTVAVQSKTSGRTTSGQKATASSQDEAVFAELAEFAQRVGAKRSVSHESRLKLADADNAIDALQEFLRGNGKPAPVAPPVAASPRSSAPPVEAHFVGEKVCATCHAGHQESFSKTLMGRIGKTQPGKFACENCHGAGSQHVKLGGGRGVGGIISFRADDLSRSVQDNNAICLACHEKGDRTYWSGSIHEVRNVACTNCHT
ncbi:MAG: hypothetical protein ACXU8R_17445, partial [Xanthobacteraceae bacterium]